jgi:hypothetical protein
VKRTDDTRVAAPLTHVHQLGINRNAGRVGVDDEAAERLVRFRRRVGFREDEDPVGDASVL